MKRNLWYVVGGLMLLAFAGFSLMSFQKNLTPYVSFEQATSTPRIVQVMGGLKKGSADYSNSDHALSFTILEPKSSKQLRVRYHGVRPGNFDDAISIVAIGRYDEGAQQFEASKLLVKCPSKYQGAEVKTYS
ncbi:MAG TPA: cytochrome c maturation protein CcmE [Thermoanaerobaculia bacterium]|jgi:cytochrome c-type biogenesis protein CcmE|nr:cytochrome c maturation protein CcmE [Thermoanaerobaculia bacterium]